MSKIKKILVTGDILRVNEQGKPTQTININWLYHLVRPSLELLSGLPISPVALSGDGACLAKQLYSINRLPLGLNSWVKLFNKRPNAREQALIHEVFQDSLVVSFELPEIIRMGLEELEIPYVDFTIHPVRFMDDLVFGLRSNIVGLAGEMLDSVVYEEEMHVAAGVALASLSRLPRIKECEEGDDLALFACQTTDDKVLIKNGRLTLAEDFLDDFAELSAAHSKILVKPHPYAKQNNVVIALTRLFPNTELIDANFYHLLSHDSISHVYSLTSSTSIEAAYFGKIGVHLGNYPYAFSDENGYGGHYLTIRPEIYAPKFWRSVLSKINVNVNAVRQITLPPERSRMRRSLRNFWGADIFEKLN
ncbi:hypothetical protein [Methylomagnum sp.]